MRANHEATKVSGDEQTPKLTSELKTLGGRQKIKRATTIRNFFQVKNIEEETSASCESKGSTWRSLDHRPGMLANQIANRSAASRENGLTCASARKVSATPDLTRKESSLVSSLLRERQFAGSDDRRSNLAYQGRLISRLFANRMSPSNTYSSQVSECSDIDGSMEGFSRKENNSRVKPHNNRSIPSDVRSGGDPSMNKQVEAANEDQLRKIKNAPMLIQRVETTSKLRHRGKHKPDNKLASRKSDCDFVPHDTNSPISLSKQKNNSSMDDPLFHTGDLSNQRRFSGASEGTIAGGPRRERLNSAKIACLPEFRRTPASISELVFIYVTITSALFISLNSASNNYWPQWSTRQQVAGSTSILDPAPDRVRAPMSVAAVQPIDQPSNRRQLMIGQHYNNISSIVPYSIVQDSDYGPSQEDPLVDEQEGEDAQSQPQQITDQSSSNVALIGSANSFGQVMNHDRSMSVGSVFKNEDQLKTLNSRALLPLDSNRLILPQMQQIKSRFNQGCVGGTKCQFFAFCWMSGGSLGASCGLLMTCCVTPSRQEIQPGFYGPVVNDPCK